MNRKPLLLTGLMTLALLAAAPAQAKTKFGITVPECGFDGDRENFCSDARMREFAQVMREQQPNFVNGLILHIYRSRHSVVSGMNSSWRMVVIDPQKRTATPFYWAFNAASQPDGRPGARPAILFDTASPRFCVKGHIEAYRNAYEWDAATQPEGFCFPYLGETGNFAGFGGFSNP